jgi:SpoVK/Ycf46/Vps4 family AAA+-type ATPase
LIAKADDVITNEEKNVLKKIKEMIDVSRRKNIHKDDDNSLVLLQKYNYTPNLNSNEALAELEELVGMENIKNDVRELINYLKIQKIREEKGIGKTSISLHSVFCGPPGTGKTTIARIIAKVYKHLGYLGKGHLVETDRSGMVGSYVGQTSEKVDDLIKTSLDGVLFVDEAYALKPVDSDKDYGQEAIDIMLKRMEDYRDGLVIIVAGYPEEMKRFIESNSGLKSRFSKYFYSSDYTPDELFSIFNIFCNKSNYRISPNAIIKLKQILTNAYNSRDRFFGNARMARNLFEKIIQKQSNRIIDIVPLTDEILSTIEIDDVPDVIQQM